MTLVNGKILKGDDCPYKDDCDWKWTVCNGEGCPFVDASEHFCDFSCASSRFFKLLDDVKERDNAV